MNLYAFLRHIIMSERTYMEASMKSETKICTGVFKRGSINREEYTAVWITLVNRLICNQSTLIQKEEKR